MRRGMILVHLHVVRRLRMRLCCAVLRGSLSLLLLLNARGDSLVERRVLQVHRWHEWSSELLLGDEWVQLGLLRRPSLKGIDSQQAAHKVDERNPVVQFCSGKLDGISGESRKQNTDLAPPPLASYSSLA